MSLTFETSVLNIDRYYLNFGNQSLGYDHNRSLLRIIILKEMFACATGYDLRLQGPPIAAIAQSC